MSEVIDLDALVPQAVVIKFGDQEISVPSPKTGDILKLGALGQKLGRDLSSEEMDALVKELTEVIYRSIPELQGKALNTAQLIKLMEIISTMAMPKDNKELEQRGVTVDTPKTNP